MTPIDPDHVAAAIRAALETDSEVAAAYLYGSVARGVPTPISDIDVAVVLAEGLDDPRRFDARLRLMDLLGRALPDATLDVTVLEDLPVAIAGRVLADGRLIYESDPARRVAVEVYTRMRYHDFLYFERTGTHEGLRGLRKRYHLG